MATLAACGGGHSGAQGDAVHLGFIVDKTGSLAPIGIGYNKGVQIAVSEWNADAKHPQIDLTTCDSQSTGDGAIACYQKLRGSVDAISGPSLFVGLAAVRSVAASGTVPLVSGAPLVDPPAGSPLFQTIPTIADGVAAGFAYFQKHHMSKVGILTSNDEPGNQAKAGASKYASKYGINLVSKEVFDPSAQNLAAQAENIAGSHPDAVLAWTAGPQLITALRALATAGVKVPIMLNYASMSTALLTKAGAGATSNTYFFASRAFDPATIRDKGWQARVKDFDKRFRAKFNTAPDLTAFDSADTVFAVGEAAKNGTSSDSIRKGLESGRPLPAFLFSQYKYTAQNHVGLSGANAFDILKYHPQQKIWRLVH